MKYMLLIYQGSAPTPRSPDAWARQALDGYLMFETDDADAAIELAARIPAARLGGAVEIRPLVEH
jgi:hypothetical protein